jgi:15-cis-phytoene synthase
MPQSSLSLRHATQADLTACRTLLCGGSRSFYAASLLLPRRVYEPATALYAFCRVADDEIDLATKPQEAVIALRQRLDAVYGDRPLAISADRALADVVSQFAIPRTLLDALIEGFAWDAEGRRYEDISGIFDYSARVAATVGAMMTLLMGVRAPDLLARACDLGVAMQLSNIARDVGEDAANGRLYLPRAWLREAGIDPDDWLANPVWSPALGSVVARLLAAAEDLYARADQGIWRLPLRCRPGIGAARLLYSEIGHEVARRGCDSVCQRAVVSPARKASLLPRVLAGAVFRPANRSARQAMPPLDETRFLVDAVESYPAPQSAPTRRTLGRGGRTVEDRAVWVLELFARLEERDQIRDIQRYGAGGARSQSLAGLAGHAVSID